MIQIVRTADGAMLDYIVEGRHTNAELLALYAAFGATWIEVR